MVQGWTQVGPKKEPKQLPLTNPAMVLVDYAWNCVALVNIQIHCFKSVVLSVNDKWGTYVRYVMILHQQLQISSLNLD